MSLRKVGISMDKIPDMSCASARNTEVMLTANPECAKTVLNMIPTDSPQFTMQKQLKKQTQKTWAVRGRPPARSTKNRCIPGQQRKTCINMRTQISAVGDIPNIANIMLVATSKGISRVAYCMKKPSTLYALSSSSL